MRFRAQLSSIFLLTGLFLVIFCTGVPAVLCQELRDEEELDYYRKWLEEDVVYIVTEQERQVFEKLTTPEEKDAFIEQFWYRRDPDPRTSMNEFKEEHYRRIAFANERFACGIEGWATDRGRTYIMFGPPKSIDRNPTGEFYIRSGAEGGGETMTYPYEAWYYENIEGIGSGMTLEFVDRRFTGDYRLAIHPYEKDALLDKPGAGLTFAEEEGLADKRARLDTLYMLRPSYRDGMTPADRSYQTFEKLEEYFALRRPQEVKFKDLREIVTTEISYGLNLEADFAYDYLYLDLEHALVPASFGLRLRDLTADQGHLGTGQVRVNIYGRVTDRSQHVHYEFEDVLVQDVTPRDGPDTLYLFQKRLPLKPGMYKLTAILEDAVSEKKGLLERLLQIPALKPDELSLSSISLLRGFRKTLDPALSLSDPFVVAGGLKIYPKVDTTFVARDENLGLFFEIYHCAIAQDTGLPRVGTHVTIEDREGETVFSADLPRQAMRLIGQRITVLHSIDLSEFEEGQYRLTAFAYDAIRDVEISAETRFSVANLN